MKINIGNDLYLKGRIGWKGLSKDEYLEKSNYRIINGYSLKDGYIDWDIAGYISKERYEESPEIKLETNDILISKDGTIGKVGIVRELELPTTVASGIFVLRNIIKDRLDTEYLFQYLKSSNFKNFINRVKASGSTIIHLYQRDLIKLEIDVPNLREQRLVSSLLKNIDAKIELNNKINSELEAMAKTLYDYWFVQFDFPDANGKPYKTSGGNMVWNEELKREIPEGWEVKELEEIENNIITGKTPSTKDEENFGGNIPFVTIDDIRQQLYVFNAERTLTKKGGDSQINKYLQPGDICVSCIGTIGVIGIIGTVCQTNQQINSISNLKDYNRYFLFNALKDYFNFNIAAKKGAVLDNMNKGDFSIIPILNATTELKIKYNETVKSFYSNIENNLKQNQQLSSLRDWLLPMLMNGQVTVGEVSKDYVEKEEVLGMVAERENLYNCSAETFNELFSQLNFDYEIAAIVSLTFQRLKLSYGKKYIHKMFSNIEMLNTLPVFKELTFEENHWGMFSPQIKKAIEQQKFIQFTETNGYKEVIELNFKYFKEVSNWIKQEENNEFITQVNDMLTLYEHPIINKKMDNIELFNTVLSCMKTLETDNFQAIYTKMKNWTMKEERYKTKADKFGETEVKDMILFIKEIKN